MQIKEITDFVSFEKLHDAWDILIENSSTQDVFLTWEWFYAWFKSYGKETNPYIITAWKNEELVGVAPFAIINQRKYGINFRILRTLSSPQCDVGGFLIRNGDVEILNAIIEQLTARQKQWDLLELNQFSKDGIEAQAVIVSLQKSGFEHQENTNKHFYIAYTQGWESYLSQLSKNFRKQVRKNERSMESIGNYTVQRFTGKNVSWNVIETIIQVNRHATYPYICNSKEDQELHRELIQAMADKGWFDAYILFVNKEPIAYEYGFLYKGRMADWRVGYDKRNNLNVSPGVFLTTIVMKTGFNEGQKEIDYLRGDEGYKNSWNPEYREYVHIKAAPRSNFLAAAAFIWLPKLYRKIKNTIQPNKK